MTGKPFYKTRVITSERLVSPLVGRRDLNDAATAFKKAVVESITRPTLNAGLSVKALDVATGNETYKDTDGKKRTNKGGTPGMVELPNGYNYVASQKWEEGKVLQLFPSIRSRKSAVKKPNFGWVDEPRSVSADEYAKVLAAKPKLRIRKYKVNQKTDEIIEESEQTLDPFSLNGDKTVNSSGYSEKRLPGKTIGQRGRSLIARAASAFGILVDENGKFRCPPGTPAANQFTDSTGANCFGISASEIFDFAKRMASGIDTGDGTRVRNTTKKLFEFISFVDNGGIPGLGRTVWRDPNGKRIRNIKKWREANKDGRSRVFVDGMIRAQDKLAQQDINIASLMDSLGVIRTDERRKTNDDVFEVFQKLRDSGAWTIDTSTRLSAEDVDKIVKARLAHVPGFSGPSPERQKSLIAADTERWYTTERALLESALDSFIADPEHMRTIAKINFQVKSPDNPEMDEASTSGITTPDTKRLMTVVNVDIPEIMNNQEAMIPSLAPGERMRIDFVGGKTDSERATALTDFLVTVDGHSKQLAAMVEERAFARHIMKHEIAHTIQFQGFAREAERQIRTNGFITVLNDKGEPVKVENVKDLNSGMVFSLMKNASDGIDLESLKNALSRADVVGFLAGDYPKMYFNDKYGADYWALEATAELWALRDLGIIYGDDIDAALEWMDDISDGRYTDIRRRSDAEGLRDIESRYYENLGPDPELTGNSIAEVKKRLEIEHKKELSQIEGWADDSSKTNDDFIDALTGLEYNREAYNDSFDNLEASGESKDSPKFKELNRKIKENNAKIALIEKKWASRFSSEDKERRRSDVRKMRESVREKMFSEGILRPEEMAARSRQEEIKNLTKQAEDMSPDDAIQKLADIRTSLKEPGLSADSKSVLLEDEKIVRAIYKSKLDGSEDPKVWSKQRRELDTRVDELVNPPRQQALKKTKKVKTDKSGASYAKKIQKDESYAMTGEQAAAVERLGDPSLTDIGNLVDPDGNVVAIKNINRRYRRAQRSAGDLSPSSETAALEDQIEKVLIPAMEAIDESSIPDDIEVEAEMYFDVQNGFKTINENFDNQSFVSGRIITDESPHKPGEVRDAKGEIVTRAGKEKSRVIVQVSKGDKGLFRTNETVLGEEGSLVLPPGKMKVVDVRPDGTIVLRVQEQDNVVDVLDRVSSSIGQEGPSASQHAKGTKKKIDRIANKYVAQRRENGLPSTPSRPKREVEIEDRNIEAKREVISAGGSFGEPPSEDYVAEVGKSPLVQPAEADIKPDQVDPQTGRPIMKTVNRMNVGELLSRRAATYLRLLEPDYANDKKGFQGTDRATLKSLDDELAKRGEIITNLPQPPEFDQDYIPGTGKRAPYKTSAGSVSDPTSGREVLGVPQTREERKVARATRANMTFEDIKRVMAGESPKDVMNDMSRDSLDSVVANEIARKSPEALIKDVEDAAVEFHAGIDKRPRVRMTENQLTKFADDGEFLPTETDDVVLESGAIGRRLERRLNPRTRRTAPKLSSGAKIYRKLERAETFQNEDELGIKRGKEISEKPEKLSSGAIERTLKPGDLKKSPTQGFAKKDGRFGEERKAFDVYDIGGESVVFGGPTNDFEMESDAKIKNVPINPYAITGLDKTSEKGQELAEKWVAARAAHLSEGGNPGKSTDVDALFYASVRGDDDAAKEFDRLSEIGLELIAEEREKSIERISFSEDDLLQERKEGLDKIGVDDLYLVHETQYDPPLDADGNIILKPLSAYELTSDSGEKVTVQRHTIHFALNHIAGGHIARQQKPGSNVIVVRLRDVLENNPDSVDSLFPVDTVLTPKPGGGIKMPKGSFQVVKTTEDGDSNEMVRTALKELGAKHFFEPGEYSSSTGAESAVRRIAKGEGFSYQMHSNMPHAYIEMNASGTEEQLGRPPTLELWPQELARMSKNAQKSVGISDKFTGTTGVMVDDEFSSGRRAGQASSNPDASSGRLSSGARVSPKQRKIQLKKVNDAENYLKNLDLQITEVDLIDSETGQQKKSPIFSVAGRPMVLVDVNGIRIPFYQSTGKGGKENPVGKWYPVFGIGKSDVIFDREFKRFVDRGGWFNKGDTYESIDNYYDVPEFKRIATILNDIDDLTQIDFHDVGVVASEEEAIELLKKNGSTGYALGKLPKARISINDDLWEVINRDLTPYSTVGDAERSGGRRWDYLNKVIDRIEKNRVKLNIDSVSIAVDKDKLSVSKESNRLKNRDVQLTVKDKNGDAIKVSIESELKTRFDDTEEQNITVRMRSNGIEVGVLHARTDLGGELGNRGELTISDILVPEDYHRRGHGKLMLALGEKYNIGSEKINHSSKLSELGELFASGTGSSGRLSSGARSGPSRTQRVAGIAGSRATGRVLDAVLKRSGADEDTRERVKYGVNMAGALAAGGPVGFATAIAVDAARRAGREIAERGLEEAVQRGRISQNQMDVAMSAVDRVAPNGLPDPVVDKLADAWTIASDFIDERVVTDENRQRLDEFGNTIRAGSGELVENAGQVIGSAREKIGKRFGRGKNKPSETDPFGDFDITSIPSQTPMSNEYDDPFAGFEINNTKPAKTEFDDFDAVFSSGRRAGRSSDVLRNEYNSRIGISKSTPNSAKPVSGYVVHRSHNEEKKRRIAASGKGNIGSDAIFEIGDNDLVGDGLTALGEIEVILKPEVSNRTAYGRGEALQSAHRPVSMNSNDPDDIADAIMNADGIASSKQNTEAMLHLLGAKMDKNFSSVNASMDENGRMAPVGAVDSSTRGHEPFEAQILGGFKKNEVEGIHYPYSKVAKIAESEDISDVVNDGSLASKLEKLGFTPEEVAYFYSISGGKPLNTASMVKLKEYRAAKKIKEKYEGMGVGYVKFAHPQGINIENPRSYDKTAAPTTRVDEILKRNIDLEVEAELKKTLDSIRKSEQLDLMVD